MKVIRTRPLDKPEELLALLTLPNVVKEAELWPSGRLRTATIEDLDGTAYRITLEAEEVLS